MDADKRADKEQAYPVLVPSSDPPYCTLAKQVNADTGLLPGEVVSQTKLCPLVRSKLQ
jgi:hypothetical protein